jgi:hypothetical protein
MRTSVRFRLRQKRTAMPGTEPVGLAYLERTRKRRCSDKTTCPPKHRARSHGFLVPRGLAACLMIRAKCSSRHAEAQRVRSDWRFRAAVIPRTVWPVWRR